METITDLNFCIFQNTKNSRKVPPGYFKWLFEQSFISALNSGSVSMETRQWRPIAYKVFKTLIDLNLAHLRHIYGTHGLKSIYLQLVFEKHCLYGQA